MSLSSFRRELIIYCLVLGSGLLAAGCATPRKAVTSMTDLGSNEAVLVGRIELAPPLQEGEQILEGMFVTDMRNRVYFLTDDHWREVQGRPSSSDFRGHIDERFGKTFYVSVPTQPLYFLKGILYLHLTSKRQEQGWLLGGLKVDLQPGDRAVYMGTIRFHRNEFMDVTKVEILDEFARENAEFAKKFGARTALKKKLATAVKAK